MHAGAFGHRHGHLCHPLGVAVGEGGLGVDDLGERAGHEVHALGGGLQGAVIGLHARDLPLRVLPGEILPQPVLPGLGEQDLHQLGVEPAPAAQPDDLLRRVWTAVREKDLGRLGEAADPGEERYLLAPEAVRVASAVPVLVEASDRPGRLLGEAHEARYLRPPLAADPD